MYGRCDYAEMDWYCCKAEGHEGPHESVPLGRDINQNVHMRAEVTLARCERLKDARQSLHNFRDLATGERHALIDVLDQLLDS